MKEYITKLLCKKAISAYNATFNKNIFERSFSYGIKDGRVRSLVKL